MYFLGLRRVVIPQQFKRCPLADVPYASGQSSRARRREFTLVRELCGQLAQGTHCLSRPRKRARLAHLACSTEKSSQRCARETTPYAHALYAESRQIRERQRNSRQ